MPPVLITIPFDRITDWESFHHVFKQTLGFPGFYGRNMDAWIDCMTCIAVERSRTNRASLASHFFNEALNPGTTRLRECRRDDPEAV